MSDKSEPTVFGKIKHEFLDQPPSHEILFSKNRASMVRMCIQLLTVCLNPLSSGLLSSSKLALHIAWNLVHHIS